LLSFEIGDQSLLNGRSGGRGKTDWQQIRLGKLELWEGGIVPQQKGWGSMGCPRETRIPFKRPNSKKVWVLIATDATGQMVSRVDLLGNGPRRQRIFFMCMSASINLHIHMT
jgi:hypothetical protein